MNMVLEKKQKVMNKSRTIKLTAAQAMVRYLVVQKTELFDGSIVPFFAGVFGIFGHGNVAGIGEALYKYQNEISYFRGHNEQGMAHAAIAYSKAWRGRRAMGVTTSIGPGSTNLVTAAALAHINRLPVLFIPGDLFSSRAPDPVLQQLENWNSPLCSVNDCLRPVSRHYDCITRPEQILNSLPRAMQVLNDPLERGPAVLSFPQDVQTETYDYPIDFFQPIVHWIQRPEPDINQLQRCISVFSQAKRPMVIAGGGVHYSGAVQALKEFSKKHGIPVAETQAGKGCLAWDDSLCLGGIGVTGTTAANEIARKSDLILCVGTRLSDFTTASKTLFQYPKVQFIGLNISSFDANKLHAFSLVTDAKRGIEIFSDGLKEYSTTKDYQEECHLKIRKWWHYADEQEVSFKKGVVTDAQVVIAVNKTVGKDAIVVGAAGGLPGELHKLWRTSRDDGYHLEYGYSCMGYEIAGGLGVKMANPDREVYVLVGDGSYLMLHTELLTARQLGFKINLILLDNKGYGCINRLQQGCGSPQFGNLLYSENGELLEVDFVANAGSYGCYSQKVNSIEELKEVIKNNNNRTCSCVTVIETDPEISTPGTAWWNVSVAENSSEKSVNEARVCYEEKKSKRSELWQF